MSKKKGEKLFWKLPPHAQLLEDLIMRCFNNFSPEERKRGFKTLGLKAKYSIEHREKDNAKDLL